MKEFDYIIVGGGSAGCVLAERLSADKEINVLLLEAGTSDNSFWIRTPLGYGRTYYDSKFNWCYRTQPDPALNNRSGYWPRGKVIGGSSSINAMVYFRGLPHDFNDWAVAGNSLWSWQYVEPEFGKIERQINVDGSLTGAGPLAVSDPGADCHSMQHEFLQAGQEAELPLNNNLIDGEGIGRYRVTIKNGKRCSAANAFLHPARKRPNLSITTAAHVQRIIIEQGKAIGVLFNRGGSEYKIYCRKEVVVCAGSINSPKLLMLSGLGPPRELQKHSIPVLSPLFGVGRNLQDHLAVTYTFKCARKTLNNRLSSHWGKMLAGAQYLVSRRGPLAMSVNQFGGLVRSDPTQPHADTQLYCNPISYQEQIRNNRPESVIDPFPGFILCFQPCRPRSRGYITLADNKPDSMPKIHPGSLQDKQDLDEVVRGGRLCQRIIDTPSFQSLISEPLGPQPGLLNDENLVNDFRQRAGTVYHPIGTCRMGPDPDNCVVDQRLRVHGVANLRVIDASVFPNLTSGNTNAPTIMLAHRAAEFIIQDL